MQRKYSVVLPVLNGEETLKTTLEHLLSIDYDDFEVVVSDNLSSDATPEILSRISDPRLKVVRPPKRLGWSENLAFAYSHATGLWQHHIGDDDVVMPSRFKILDQLLERFPESDMLWGRAFRYYWPSYGDQNLANRLNSISFNASYGKLPRDLVDVIIRGVHVDAGQSFIVSKSVIQKCIRKYGFFVSSQHGEAFSYRAALLNSENISLIDLPLGINGRHSKSIATQHLQSKEHYKEKGETDIQYSDPEEFAHTPWSYKGYTSWSLDALCLLVSLDERVKPLTDLEWVMWGYNTVGEINSLKNKGQLTVTSDFVADSLVGDNEEISTAWKSRNFQKVKSIEYVSRNSFWPSSTNSYTLFAKDGLISFPEMDVDSWGVDDISTLAHAIETKLPLYYRSLKWCEVIDRKISDKWEELQGLKAKVDEESKKRITSISRRRFQPENSSLDSSSIEVVPGYMEKYSQFESGLNNYYFRKGGVCNPPTVVSHEYASVEMIDDAIRKLQTAPIAAKIKDPMTGRIVAYDEAIAPLRKQKNSLAAISALVVGNGPSQEMLSFEAIRDFQAKGHHVYALNWIDGDAGFPLESVTHYITSDHLVFSHEYATNMMDKRSKLISFLDKYRPEIFLPVHREFDMLDESWGVTFFEDRHRQRWQGGGWEPDKPRCYWSNTLLKALAITRFLGYNKVYVIGADTSYPQCIRSAPDGQLAMVESHANLVDRLTQGYPLSSSMHKYMLLLSYWFWSYEFICDHRFVNLDPLSLVDSMRKINSRKDFGWDLLNRDAQSVVADLLQRYASRDMTPV